MSSEMNRAQAEEYAKTMSYKEAVMNCIHAKGIAYRKASLIKLRELAKIADKLEVDLTNGNTITKAEYDWESSEHICKECQFYPIYCQMGAPDRHWKACEGFVPKNELAKMKGGAK